MTAVQILRNIQARQREHDIRAHQDIYYLPSPARMNHLTLHITKYAGRLAQKDVAVSELKRTIVDAFIIALSAADLLRIDFTEALGIRSQITEQNDFMSLGFALRGQDCGSECVEDWYFRKLAEVAGKMAKACESLDHMESVPYREVLSEAILDLCRATLAVSSMLSLDLVSEVGQQWEKIEAQRIL